MVMGTASNMNKLGRLVEDKFVSTVPHYCTDHNLQLTTQKSYGGDIVTRLGGVASNNESGEGNIVRASKKACDLASHVSQSPSANAKLANAQKNLLPETRVFVLIQNVKTQQYAALCLGTHQTDLGG